MVREKDEWLKLPRPDRIEFENPPLVLSTCQIHFNKIMSISNEGEIWKFQNAILDEYPLSDPFKDMEFRVQFGPEGGSLDTKQHLAGWTFSDIEGNWIVSLAPDSLSLENRRYRNFSEFLDRLNFLVATVMRLFRPSILFRVGLRYINEIPDHRRINGAWADTVNGALLGPLPDAAFRSGRSQAVHRFSHTGDDGRGLNLQYGILPADQRISPIQNQAPSDQEFFFLDIDVYHQFNLPSGQKLTPVNIDELASGFNKDIWKVFRWAVTDEFVESLEVRS